MYLQVAIAFCMTFLVFALLLAGVVRKNVKLLARNEEPDTSLVEMTIYSIFAMVCFLISGTFFIFHVIQ